MVQHDAAYRLVSPDEPTAEGALRVFQSMNPMPVPWMEPADISDAVVWLASPQAKYVTGITLSVDAGYNVK